MTDWVGDLYFLNSKIQETNGHFKQIGKGYAEDVFCNINTTFNFFTPRGDRNRLFNKK